MRIYRYQSEEQKNAVNSISAVDMNAIYENIYQNEGIGILLESGRATGIIYEDKEDVSV